MMDRRSFMGTSIGGITSLVLGCATKAPEETAPVEPKPLVGPPDPELIRKPLLNHPEKNNPFQEKLKKVYRLVKQAHNYHQGGVDKADNWWTKSAVNVGIIPRPNRVILTAEEYRDKEGQLMYEALKINQHIITGPNPKNIPLFNEDIIVWIDIGVDGFDSKRYPCRRGDGCSSIGDAEIISRWGDRGPKEHTQNAFSDLTQPAIDEANKRYERFIDFLLTEGYL